MSRRGLLIRVLIFGPLFAYFGFGAVQKCRSEQQAERDMVSDQAARDAELKAATTKRALPGGGSIDVVELSPEQAERLYGIKQAPEDAKEPAPASDVKPPATEAKAADVTAPDTKVDAKAPDAKAEAKAN
jgi:hypothetical protein